MPIRKEFRTGWLLLLLRDEPGYGYELRRALERRTIELDRAVLYRSLRTMEHAGLIASGWSRSTAGPRRRVYEITDAGRQELDRIARAIEVASRAHAAFLDAYDPVPAKRARAGPLTPPPRR